MAPLDELTTGEDHTGGLESKLSSEALEAAAFLETIRTGDQWLNLTKEPWNPTEEEQERLKLTIKLLMNFAINIEDASLKKFHFNQLKGIQEFKEFLQNAGVGKLSGYIHQATGAGKTVLFALISKLLGVKTLILVPKKNLLEQTKGEFVNMLGFDEKDIGILGGGKEEIGRNTTISTYQSHMRRMKSDRDYRKQMAGVELVICDEAHKGIGEETQESLDDMEALEPDERASEVEFEKDIDAYISRLALRIGFTATPKLAEKDVANFFGRLISRVTMTEMVKAGILKKYRIVQAGGEINTERKNLSEKEESEILEHEEIYEKLLDKFEETRKTSPYPLKPGVFCTSIKECEKFLEIAESKGMKGMIVTSKIGKNSLEEAEKKILSGEIDMIITVDKLTEGWNFPALNSVIWARACGSPARIIQAAGRAARYFKGQDYAYFFETNWTVRRKPKDKKDKDGEDGGKEDEGKDENDSNKNDDDDKEEASLSKGSLTLTKALYESGEDTDTICEGIDGNSIEFTKEVLLDEKECGVIEINNESGVQEQVEVMGGGIIAASLYGKAYELFYREIDKAGLQPIKGYKGRTSLRTLLIYRKAEIDELFSEELKIIELDRNACGTINISKDGGTTERMEVVGAGIRALKFYETSRTNFISVLKDSGIKPIKGWKGRVDGEHTVPLYIKSDLDKLFKKNQKTVELDENGFGTIDVNIEGGSAGKVEVVGMGKKAANKYGVHYKTFLGRIDRAGIQPVQQWEGKSGPSHIVPLYLKSELDPLFDKI
ncbi:MAG: DEAD/DEAH box helicase family protein [Candidatus Peregrinibacteria bacterium]|nr:DEAD/DEAH box helicase family protein [Candidatus Peregrinibacteria bacterium]